MRQRRALQPSLLIARFQVLHLAAVPRGNPARKVFQLRSIIDRSDPRKLKPRVCSGFRQSGRDFNRSQHDG